MKIQMLRHITIRGLVLLAATVLACISGLATAEVSAAPPNPLAGLGGRLAYVDAYRSLVVLNGQTGGTQTLIHGNNNRTIWNPAWSPDGSYIAFIAFTDDRHIPRDDDVYVVAADGSGAARRVTQYVSDMSSLGWFPNSQVILYGAGFYGLFSANRINVDGQFQQTLYPTDGNYGEGYLEPVVSPDGLSIASTQRTSDDGLNANANVYVSASDGSSGGVIANTRPNYDGGVSWLPDSSGVVYASGPFIMQAPLDGSAAPHAVIGRGGQIRGTPALTPDGSQVAFVYDGGQVLGDQGPTTEWRLAVVPLSNMTSRYYVTGINPDAKLQWVAGTQGILFQTGVSGRESQTLHLLSFGDVTADRTVAPLGGYLEGYDWHPG